MNLRKDHYRSVPGNATVCQRRTRSLCRGWVWRSGCQPPTPKGLSNSLVRRLRGGSRGGEEVGACAAFFSSLFFFPLRGQTLSSAPASPPRATGPGRRPPPPGTKRIAGPPRRRGRAASRVSQNSPRSSGALGRGVQSPRRRQRRPRGARRFRLDTTLLYRLSPNVASRKTQKEYTTLSGGSLGSCVDEERS